MSEVYKHKGETRDHTLSDCNLKEELNSLWNVHTVIKRFRVRRALNARAPSLSKANTVCNAVPILKKTTRGMTRGMGMISMTGASAPMAPVPGLLLTINAVSVGNPPEKNRDQRTGLLSCPC